MSWLSHTYFLAIHEQFDSLLATWIEHVERSQTQHIAVCECQACQRWSRVINELWGAWSLKGSAAPRVTRERLKMIR